MADDLAKRGPIDRTRVNLNEAYEIRYWCERLDCSPDELRAAVKAVGIMVDKVKLYLNRRRR